MNKEQLSRANDIQKQLAMLDEHKKQVERHIQFSEDQEKEYVSGNRYGRSGLFAKWDKRQDWDSMPLYMDLMPISHSVYMKMYLLNLEKICAYEVLAKLAFDYFI